MHPANSSVRPPGRRPVIGIPRRRILGAAAGFMAPLLPQFARAAAFTWRLGHNAPTDFALHLRLIEAAAAIAARSEGQMTLEVHPDSELGSPIGLLSQVRAGTIDAAPFSSQMLAKDLPIAALPMLGFAFAGYNQLWPAIDGDTGGFLRTQIRERLGLEAMARCWDFGFRQITTSGKPVNAAADLAGLRLRTPPESDFIGLFQALQALPIAMPLSALESALRTWTIDGQESVLPLVQAAGLSKVQSICALTNHVWDGEWICISTHSWSKLPPRMQDIVAGALNECALRQRQDIADAQIKLRHDLEAEGMKFNAVDPGSFRSALRQYGYFAAWRSRMGEDGWAALEKYTGRLA